MAEAVAAAAGWPADEEARPLKVVFGSPAKYFTDAAPIGNGRLGAMVWGGVESERLQLNRKPPLPLHPCSWIVLGCFAPLYISVQEGEKGGSCLRNSILLTFLLVPGRLILNQ
jgi:hypothetical protein